MKDGRLQTVSARKEIILSAGTIGSPHILMLSGIGHKEHLKKYGVSFTQNCYHFMFSSLFIFELAVEGSNHPCP